MTEWNNLSVDEKLKGKKPKGVDVEGIRKNMFEELHEKMDMQIDSRHHRFEHAKLMKNVDRMYDLLAAAFEEANINFFGLTNVAARKARGRSKVNISNNKGSSLRGTDKLEECEEEVDHARWLRKHADVHNGLGNKLTSLAKRLKAKENTGQSG